MQNENTYNVLELIEESKKNRRELINTLFNIIYRYSIKKDISIEKVIKEIEEDTKNLFRLKNINLDKILNNDEYIINSIQYLLIKIR